MARLTNPGFDTTPSARSAQQGHQPRYAGQHDQNLGTGSRGNLAAPGNLTFSLDPLSEEGYSMREEVNARWRASASLRELEHIRWGKHAARKLPQTCPNDQKNEL